ncbi:hypothetical protein PR003_g5701 [Phytophthora rubi]|uniref:Stc1 domain-containing protein n=1 Tax=Phytophthora rubi TaxID=129364 RepID=A0A6A3MT48_9STRA|nr:hypothetical protein PR002_g8249 [Phytophthora rubi]KAE9349795.1 hypothetical protein PR003_g5701 [Phytophthora rubi]
MDELSSTESEGGESYDGYDAQVPQSTPLPAPPTHAIVTPPPAPSAGINILDLQCALATHPPAPEVFVIPRRPVATPSSPRVTEVQSRDEVDPSTERPCGHSLTPPMAMHRPQQDPVETFSCTCCKRKDMDAPNFSKAQRAVYKAATRKCRDCTYQLPSTGPKNKRKRVRNAPRFRAKHADRPPREEGAVGHENEQVMTDQRTKMTLQQWHENKRLHEGAPPPRATQEERRPQPQPALPQRQEEHQRPTAAEKKQLKRQRRAQVRAEIDRDPPPPRTRHPPRAAAIRAQEEWRHKPQPRRISFGTPQQRQEEHGGLPKQARNASSQSVNSQHSTRDHFPSHRQSWY